MPYSPSPAIAAQPITTGCRAMTAIRASVSGVEKSMEQGRPPRVFAGKLMLRTEEMHGESVSNRSHCNLSRCETLNQDGRNRPIRTSCTKSADQNTWLPLLTETTTPMMGNSSPSA